jgi:asparagine synthase (glutamine-hydrolysing)
MCGIAGIVYENPEARVEDALVRRMCDAIRHRGPDDDGVFADRGAGLGMRRLSIIDVAGGHQPIFNEDRSCVIVYNGEIYNHREVRAELERRGHRYRTESDTETILHAYEEYGDACVEHLRGMFGIAIWDTKRRRLFLARDRFGKKPLYYTIPGGSHPRLVFGSELKAILVVPGVERRVDPQAVADYAAWGYVPDPLSIYQGIAKLPPAHTCRQNHHRHQPRRLPGALWPGMPAHRHGSPGQRHLRARNFSGKDVQEHLPRASAGPSA